MGNVSEGDELSGVVSEWSNSDNPVLTDPAWDKKIVLTGEQNHVPDIGDRVTVVVLSEDTYHYRAKVALQSDPGPTQSSGDTSAVESEYSQSADEQSTHHQTSQASEQRSDSNRTPHPVIGKQYEETVTGSTNTGNAVVTESGWDRRVVVLTDDQVEVGMQLHFAVKKDNGNHYLAVVVGQGTMQVSKPDYSSSSNVPLHHDGKHGESVADTRAESAAMKSREKREFNPKTHGAPKTSEEQNERRFLRQDE